MQVTAILATISVIFLLDYYTYMMYSPIRFTDYTIRVSPCLPTEPYKLQIYS